MPGLLGTNINISDSMFQHALNSINHFEENHDANWSGKSVQSSVIGQSSSSYINNTISVYVYGRINKLSEFENLNIKVSNEAELIAKSYQNAVLESTLSKIDGIFSFTIYDSISEKLILGTDRLGMMPLYYHLENGYISWSSELKAFPVLIQSRLNILPEAIDVFIETGQLIAEMTWFENVKSLLPSSILSFDIAGQKIDIKRYWSWQNIKSQTISHDEAIESIHEITENVFNNISLNKQFKYNLGLSGGVDSRFLLSGLCNKELDIQCYSVGQDNSQDVIFARKVSDIANVNHSTLRVSQDNWLTGKPESIWKSDCAISMIHFHGSPYHNELANSGKTLVNGMAGDLIMGGSWLEKNEHPIIKVFDKYHDHELIVRDTPQSSFYSKTSMDPFFICSRVRRFTFQGLLGVSPQIPVVPFISNQLLEFIYSIDDKIRGNYKLYIALIKKYYADLFQEIPVIGYNEELMSSNWLGNKKTVLFHRIKQKMNLEKAGFAIHNEWLGANKNLFESILSKESILSSLFNIDLTNINDSRKKFRLLSLEIWFQQIFNNNFKSSESIKESIEH